MFKWFVLLIVLVPAVEIWVLIEVGQTIGGWPTFALIVLTGLVGAYLTRLEVKKVMQFARHQLDSGRLPGRAILDGICLFAGGLMLLTPGFITDAAGLLLILPVTRPLFHGGILLLIKQLLNNSRIRFFRHK